MKLKTTLIWATVGVLASTAGAMAIPVPKGTAHYGSGTDPIQSDAWWQATSHEISRFSAGETVSLDARLGHASIADSGNGETFLFAQVTGGDTTSVQAPPLNLAIVVDRSGSMKGERIANAIAGAVGSVDRMRDGDTVTVVTFDTDAQVVVAPTRVTADARPRIENAIRSIRLGGDTCMSCGLEEAMRQLDTVPGGDNHVNRMMLLSDGAANHGVRDVTGLRALAGRMRDRGFSVSTIGVDVDFDERVMAAIASESNGKHYFVANPTGLPAIFSEEFDSLVASVARDAELEVELAPGVNAEQVFDRSFRREGDKIIVPFGTVSAKQEKTMLMRLRVPTTKDGVEPVAGVRLVYRDLVKNTDGSCDGKLALLVTDDGKAQHELDPFVAARLERSRTAETLTTANLLIESGRGDEARSRVTEQKAKLAAIEKKEVDLANASPHAAPRHASRSVDKDFEDQIGALAQAESGFAQPPPASKPAGGSAAGPFATAPGVAAAPPAPSPADDRKVRGAVRANQQNASEFGF